MYNVQCTIYNVQCTMYNVQYTMYNVQCTMYTHFRAQHSFHSSHSNDDCNEKKNATRWSLLSIVSTSTTVTLKTAPWLLQSKQRKEEQFRKSFGGVKLKWYCPGISTCPLGCEGTRSTSCGTTSSSGSLWRVGLQRIQLFCLQALDTDPGLSRTKVDISCEDQDSNFNIVRFY